MELLTPQKINTDKSRSLEASRKRTVALGAEESRLVKRVNHLKDEEKEAQKKLEILALVTDETLAIKRTVLFREVEMLEARKFEALKPIEIIRTEIRELLAENKKDREYLEIESSKIKSKKEEIVERVEQLLDRENGLAETEKKLDSRAIGMVAGENEIKRSTSELSDKWIVYHEAVGTHNEKSTKLVEREEKVELGVKANEIRQAEQDAREHVLYEKNRGIIDGYRALQAAIAEHEKKGIKISS